MNSNEKAVKFSYIGLTILQILLYPIVVISLVWLIGVMIAKDQLKWHNLVIIGAILIGVVILRETIRFLLQALDKQNIYLQGGQLVTEVPTKFNDLKAIFVKEKGVILCDEYGHQKYYPYSLTTKIKVQPYQLILKRKSFKNGRLIVPLSKIKYELLRDAHFE